MRLQPNRKWLKRWVGPLLSCSSTALNMPVRSGFCSEPESANPFLMMLWVRMVVLLDRFVTLSGSDSFDAKPLLHRAAEHDRRRSRHQSCVRVIVLHLGIWASRENTWSPWDSSPDQSGQITSLAERVD